MCLGRSLKEVLKKFFTSLFQIGRLQSVTILESIEMKLLKERIRNNRVKNFRVVV